MTLKDLEYFQLLMQLKSFTAVAQKLNISQPTITYSVKRLEKEFGTDLVLRDQAHHLVKFTPAGKVLYSHIKNILEEISITQAEIQRLSTPKIDIGLPPIIGNYYFSKLSALFLENNVHNDVNFISGGSHEMFQLLKKGRLTLSLIAFTDPILSDNLKSELLAEKKFVIVVSPEHPFACKDNISFSELKNEPFVMLNERFIHTNAFRNLSKLNHITPEIVYQSNDLNILKRMIKQQMGIGFLTEIAITDTDELVKIPLSDDLQPKFLISLVQSESSTLSESQLFIADLIRNMNFD